MSDTVNDYRFTPDLPDLCKWQNHYVFAYGTLKHGFPRYREDDVDTTASKFLGSGHTDAADFYMYNLLPNDKNPSFPAVFREVPPELGDIKARRVQGDLFLVSTERLMELDRIESNGQLYKRQLTQVSIMAKLEGGHRAKWGLKRVWAWMYVVDCTDRWFYDMPVRRITTDGAKQDLKFTMDMCYNFHTATPQGKKMTFTTSSIRPS